MERLPPSGCEELVAHGAKFAYGGGPVHSDCAGCAKYAQVVGDTRYMMSRLVGDSRLEPEMSNSCRLERLDRLSDTVRPFRGCRQASPVCKSRSLKADASLTYTTQMVGSTCGGVMAGFLKAAYLPHKRALLAISSRDEFASAIACSPKRLH